jgi:predicted RNase H-like nuclease (RuvC/YqgF family)
MPFKTTMQYSWQLNWSQFADTMDNLAIEELKKTLDVFKLEIRMLQEQNLDLKNKLQSKQDNCEKLSIRVQKEVLKRHEIRNAR